MADVSSVCNGWSLSEWEKTLQKNINTFFLPLAIHLIWESSTILLCIWFDAVYWIPQSPSPISLLISPYLVGNYTLLIYSKVCCNKWKKKIRTDYITFCNKIQALPPPVFLCMVLKLWIKFHKIYFNEIFLSKHCFIHTQLKSLQPFRKSRKCKKFTDDTLTQDNGWTTDCEWSSLKFAKNHMSLFTWSKGIKMWNKCPFHSVFSQRGQKCPENNWERTNVFSGGGGGGG